MPRKRQPIKRLPLANSSESVMVDADLFQELSKYNWQLLKGKYVYTKEIGIFGHRRPTYLTRFILRLKGLEPAEQRYRVRQINSNFLDLRAANLTVEVIKTEVRNVWQGGVDKLWYVNTKHEKRTIESGFATEEAAINRYLQLCLQHPKIYLRKYAPKDKDLGTLSLMLERAEELQALFARKATADEARMYELAEQAVNELDSLITTLEELRNFILP